MTVSAPPSLTSSTGSAYSRAFESLTGGERDDIVGLLAYARYKKAIWEAVANGTQPTPGMHRNPQLTEVQAYRSAAERRLQAFAEQAIEDAGPEILDNAILTDLGTISTNFSTIIKETKTDLSSLIVHRTKWLENFLISVGAWLFSLFVT
jgi:hypothetical protein